MTNQRIALFIFRRDLRLADNIALIECHKHADQVIPCFIFDPRQVGTDNEFRGNPSIQFMIESLADLNLQLEKHGGRLFRFHGLPEQILGTLKRDLGISSVFFNRDYTPFSRSRDADIERVAKELDIEFRSYDDALLNPPESVLKQDAKPYVVFTPYFRAASKVAPPKVVEESKFNFYSAKIGIEVKDLSRVFNGEDLSQKLWIKGGRQEGLRILSDLATFKSYSEERDFPALSNTTHLSSHNKFGTLSIREVYWNIARQLGAEHPLIRQLYWRDFLTQITWHFPHVLGKSFHLKYEKIKWSRDSKLYEAWCHGMTGFPLVDAGMRQLNQTGFMHNRVRMLVASFLVKDLHLDWRLGERYFARKLIDYDPAVNNGNWQWAASTGCDAQPYFRIFNPWIQQKKFDKDCQYIKKWVPELVDLTSSEIHKWENEQKQGVQYPEPIVDHSIAKQIAEDMFKLEG